MRLFVIAATLIHFTAAAMAGSDPMETRYGNTTIALSDDGSTARIFYSPNHSFKAKQDDWEAEGRWDLHHGKLCLSSQKPFRGIRARECFSAKPHRVGDVWIDGKRRFTLVEGMAFDDSPQVLAALAAASRVGNTVVAKDPDGTETRLYWRPDHSFTAKRPGWKTEGTWRVEGASLFLHYNIPRPGMGSDEEMKNATPRKPGEVWGMADRKVTLMKGEQLGP